MPRKNNKQENLITENRLAIAKLNERVGSIKETLDDFIDNEFTHLRTEVKEIRSWLFFGFLGTMIISVIAQILLKFFQ